jgi:hypothetical protein
LAVVLYSADACFSRQTNVLAVLEPPAPAAQSASGVDAPLSTNAHVRGRGAQAGAQTVACGDAMLPQKDKKNSADGQQVGR